MSRRFRLYPTKEQEQQLLVMCGHTRFIWNLAVESFNYSTRSCRAPSWLEMGTQLTELRHEQEWMRAVPSVIQREVLRQFGRAFTDWCHGRRGRPRFRSPVGCRRRRQGRRASQRSPRMATPSQRRGPYLARITAGAGCARCSKAMRGRVVSERDLPEVVEMPPAMSDLMMWAGGTRFDTAGCTCGHETLGPSWHLSFCPWPASAWRAKARELAEQIDAGVASYPECRRTQ